jgi:REP element-mobilizing transposase RayT
MSRPLRLNVPGACYHLIARGNARESVFIDDLDRRLFLEVLRRVVDRFGWVVYAYCLMGNHYHLVVETPRGQLSRGMGQLNGPYARHFNRRFDRCGHVFQARFRSILIERDARLLVVCRYVVLNPVRAWLCQQPDEWLWSSYRASAGLDAPPGFLAADQLLARFARTRERAQAAYRQFVADGLGDQPDQHVIGERLGEARFLRERIPADDEIPRAHVEPVPPSLAEIFAAEDQAPILTAYRRHGYTLAQIADHLGRHYSTISRKLRAAELDARA